ncbi:MAG: trehalase family glycosidase, partial [Bacteroidota bacterium]
MKKLLFLSTLLWAVACSTPSAPEVSNAPTYYLPWEQLQPLFDDVQMAGIFEDSKTFVDWTPKQSPETILKRFVTERDRSSFDLEAFVKANFDPPYAGEAREVDTDKPIKEHLSTHWDYLTRSTRDQPPFTTLIPMQEQYVVPGGRFREVYYWDSYFTMIGLGSSGRIDLVESMLDNFAYLIDTVGFIPNGNRTYYLGRSQPPYFSSMVNLFIQHTSMDRALKYLPAIQKEYDFWMDGAENLTPQHPEGKRVVLH